MKTTETQIQQRFGDIDQMRHVNNARQMEYLDIGKADFAHRVMMHAAQVENVTPVVVSIKVDFVAQVLWGDDIRVRTWVEKIGNKSVTLRQQIYVRKRANDAKTDETASGNGVASTVGGSVEQCSGTGYTCADGIAERICTEAVTVMVAYDRSTGESVEFPQIWRNRIEE